MLFKSKKPEQALSLQNEGNWQDALLIWDEILASSKNDHQALISSGNCSIKIENYGDAEQRFSRVLEDKPDDESGLSGLAIAYLKQEKLSEAQEVLFRIKHLYPDNLNTYLTLCQLYMRFKQFDIAKRFSETALERFPDNAQLQNLQSRAQSAVLEVYDQDGLWSKHNHDFMDETPFVRAYERGIKAAQGQNYNWHWRVHTGLWAAMAATRIEGDYVECGVNRGFLSSAIMTYLDWDKTGRQYFLLDTFEGIDPKYASDTELASGILSKNQNKLDKGSYTNSFDEVKDNFSEWENKSLIKGSVPETLEQITATRIAFLHLDMNSAEPERAALDYLWDRLTTGAIILMDDYAYKGYEAQHVAMKTFSEEKGRKILSLPTGQGLMIK